MSTLMDDEIKRWTARRKSWYGHYSEEYDGSGGEPSSRCAAF